ncbi:SGNH/GDSL hydrolase family protein [Pseudoroseomonas cervicalis]|uniref:SGNH/GDSL hydrolase family protein n=1 Tax=Teichococcus cervicalis TaxID=204525 RepID=UPI0022F18DBD|nr:SGNH/GDSL hydrolase family protein [Pseudoroseomonas cervicalis]WBV44030.1 SGNH/GDSL hydrolase family protein [Pseudoroseomonas cervicalis]
MPRLLVLGFSNTALNTGYTAPLRRLLGRSHPELEIRVCGLGGLGPQVVPVMFERMHRLHGPFTHVLLEIATSIYARNTPDSREEAEELIADCLNRVAETGARPALLHLLRTDLAGARLPFAQLLTDAAQAQGYPVVDLAEGLVARKGRDFALSLLRDTVHTTPEGSLHQAREIAEALGEWLRMAGSPAGPARPARRRQALPLLPHARERDTYVWQDLTCEVALIRAGETLQLQLPEPLLVYGLSFILGPRSGRLDVGLDTTSLSVPAYDEHCFYRRLGLHLLQPAQQRPRRSITLRQDPALPTLPLRRGEADPSPREGQPVDLLYLG